MDVPAPRGPGAHRAPADPVMFPVRLNAGSSVTIDRAFLLVLLATGLGGSPLVAQRRQHAPPPSAPAARKRAVAPVTPVVPSPRAVLGFEPGDDRKLADWPTLL